MHRFVQAVRTVNLRVEVEGNEPSSKEGLSAVSTMYSLLREFRVRDRKQTSVRAIEPDELFWRQGTPQDDPDVVTPALCYQESQR